MYYKSVSAIAGGGKTAVLLNTFSKGLARCSGSNWVFFPDPNWLCAPGANRHQFDSFCRKVLREEARDYERHIAWRSNHEVSLSELSEEQERQMYVLDEYPSEQTHFHVRGYDVAIENENLANALTVLPDDKRDIVLLAFFLDMTDQEIADKLDMVRRTVQYKRAQSLKELKKEMEVTEDGAQSE